MRSKKSYIFTLLFVLGITLFIFGEARRAHTYPGNYPNSRWEYGGEFGIINLTVEDECGYYKGTIEVDGEKTYAEFAFDSLTRSIYILPLTQEEYNNDKANPHADQALLRGTFRCTKKAFTITSHHYSDIFGLEGLNTLVDEESPKIKLVLERVE